MRNPFCLFDIPPSSLPVLLAPTLFHFVNNMFNLFSTSFMLPASQSFLARVDVWIRAVRFNIRISEMDKAYRKSLVSFHSQVKYVSFRMLIRYMHFSLFQVPFFLVHVG
jgi:hypothetical protein